MKFANDVMQRSTTVGDGATLTMGVVYGNRILFRDKFADGDIVGYCDRSLRESPGGTDKREYGYGTLTYGGPADGSGDTIVRNVSSSTEGNAKIDWSAGDVHAVMSVPDLDVFSALLQPDWVDTSAGAFPITAAHFGNVLKADLSGGNVARTLPTIASLGDRAHGFVVRLYGYGSTANSITLTPGSGDSLNEEIADATMSIVGGRMITAEVDGDTFDAWRVTVSAA